MCAKVSARGGRARVNGQWLIVNGYAGYPRSSTNTRAGRPVTGIRRRGATFCVGVFDMPLRGTRTQKCRAPRNGYPALYEPDFVQRLVAANIAGANLFSGSSRPKSRVRIPSADRRGQNRVPVFVQRIVAAKIRGANSFSGSSRPKSGVCFCSAGRRGQNRVPVFVQRIVAAKIGCLFLFSGSSRRKSGGRLMGRWRAWGDLLPAFAPPLWGRRTDTGRFTPTRLNH